jgi:two-component system NtrC family sensor kinase
VNAVTHAFAPGEKGTLALSIAQEQDVAVIRFRDNGMGMSSEVLRQIFEPFFTTKRGKGGTGLGLRIIYTLVTDSLNGRVYCESEPGCGSEFVITLPMIDQLVACNQ